MFSRSEISREEKPASDPLQDFDLAWRELCGSEVFHSPERNVAALVVCGRSLSDASAFYGSVWLSSNEAAEGDGRLVRLTR